MERIFLSILIQNEAIKVIDFHVHTFPDKIAEKAVSKLEKISGLTPATNGTLGDTIRKLEQNHVDHAVLLNIATTPSQQSTINQCAQKINDTLSDKFSAFGSVHFLNKDALNELMHIKERGIKGIKLHPDYQEFEIDDARLFPIYEKCCELELPIVFHAGWDCYSPDFIHAKPIASRRVIDMFPKLQVVLAHMGGIYCWDDVEKYLIGQNVYLDTSMCCTYAEKSQIERMIKNHDENRILFGTDCPWGTYSQNFDYLKSMNLSLSHLRKIFHQNAETLLKL